MERLESLGLADQRVYQDFAERQEDAGCLAFRVSLALKVKEALPAKPGHQGRMERTVFREPLAKMAIQEKMARTDCLARTEQMVKMAWMESTDYPGGQAKSARTETRDPQDCLANEDLAATMGRRAVGADGARPVLKGCRDQTGLRPLLLLLLRPNQTGLRPLLLLPLRPNPQVPSHMNRSRW